MTTENKIIKKSLHTQAFWLYSTVVALAIKEALTGTIPYLITPPLSLISLRLAVGFRLVTFLVLAIRFYLGSVIFFEYAHAGESADVNFPSKSYALDFLFGIVHFLLFFVWAFSIDIHTKPTSLFPSLLAIILLYDFLWLIACHKYPTHRLMKLWTAINISTVVCGICIYVFVSNLFDYKTVEEQKAMAEQAVFSFIIVVSILDIWELITQKKIFRSLFARLID